MVFSFTFDLVCVHSIITVIKPWIRDLNYRIKSKWDHISHPYNVQCCYFFKRAKYYEKTGEKWALFQQKNGQKTGEIKNFHGKKRAVSDFFKPHVVTLQGYFKHYDMSMSM